jgi:hypothetical protein
MMITRFLAVLAPPLFGLALGCGGRTPSGSQNTGGTGGAGGGGGLDAASTECTAGTVTFELSAADGRNASYCVGLNCTDEWVTVRSQQGAAMPLSFGCSTKCEDCVPMGCPLICRAPKPMKEVGESFTWNGEYWPDSMCGGNQTCRSKKCATPGKYTARMCAAPSTSDAGSFCTVGAAKCIEVEFEYPSATPVDGAI